METRPIRVLHVLGSMGRGGVETWLMHVMRRIDREQVQFDFCTCWPQPEAFDQEVEELGGKVLPCSVRENILTFPYRFGRLVREGHYHVVHSHSYSLSGIVLRVARQAGVPVRIAHSHSTSDGKASTPPRLLYRALMRHWIRNHATHGLAASEAAAEALFGKAWRSDARFCVLHCGIDLEPFRQSISRIEVGHELGIPVDAPVVGHVGSFRPPKNHAFLLEIAAEVIKRRPEVRFLLVGDGPLRPAMEAKAHNLGIEKNVIFAGTRGDVPRLMLGAMDAFLLPSLWEGLGLVVVEAQASGLRCLVSGAVPLEAVLARESLEHVALNAGVDYWTGRLLKALEQGRIPLAEALAGVARSTFAVENSCRYLAGLYSQPR